MLETEAYYIPKHLDEPERVLFWSIDELLIMILPVIIIGFCFNYFILSMLIAGVGVTQWKKFKGSEQANLHLYMMYWFYPPSFLSLKATPKSYIRKYFG